MTLSDFIDLIPEPNRTKCRKLYESKNIAFDNVPGSLSKHQAWTGGLVDHILETAMIAETLYERMKQIRPLGFSIQDVYLILFLHDIEKAWRYEKKNGQKMATLRSPAERKQFTLDIVEKFSIELDADQMNALQYIEGEGEAYNPDFRVMKPLAAFCHVCDTISSRIWHEYPRKK